MQALLPFGKEFLIIALYEVNLYFKGFALNWIFEVMRGYSFDYDWYFSNQSDPSEIGKSKPIPNVVGTYLCLCLLI